MRLVRCSLALALVAAGCTPPPENVAARAPETALYAGVGCDRLAQEKVRLATEFNTHAANQDTNANVDAGLVSGGVIIAWPLLIGLAFTKSHADEMGQVRAKYDGAAASARAQNCTPAPVQPVVLANDPLACQTSGGDSSSTNKRAMTARAGAWCADVVSARASNGTRGAYRDMVVFELPRYGDVEVLPAPNAAGNAVVYRPMPGFAGDDSFSLAGRVNADTVVRYRYSVTVPAP